MNRHIVLNTALAFAINLGLFNIAHAQLPASDDVAFEFTASDGRWTVLTMAPDGSWGAATESSSNRAIANAVAECKFKYRAAIGCGGYQVAVQRGWVLGIRCGNENILVAALDLAIAKQSALLREVELRRSYVPDMPACRRVVTIDPRGTIAVPTKGQASAR